MVPNLTLFDTDSLRVETDSDLSADRRRTIRQKRQIDAGFHPLWITAGYSKALARLHPNAVPEICSPEAPKGRPYTCGSCRFRMVLRWHDRTYPKCTAAVEGTQNMTAPSITHGAATDVRAWWPACIDYQPGDQGLSPDAYRCLPGE